MVQYNKEQNSTVQYNTVVYSTVHYITTEENNSGHASKPSPEQIIKVGHLSSKFEITFIIHRGALGAFGARSEAVKISGM